MSVAPEPRLLTPEQLRALADATSRMKKIRRAVKWASFDGWMLALFGGFTLLGGLGTFSAMLLGAGLCIVAFLELRGARQLKQLNPLAPRLLTVNQLALAGLLIAYAVYCLVFPTPLSADIQASAGDFKSLGYDPQDIYGSINTLLYATLIFVALITAAIQAPFYFRRGPMVREYLTETPEWVIQMQRVGVSV